MTEPKEEKCEACCGSGYINFWTDDGHISMRTCRRCDGYGYIKAKPLTNEEWLRTATTEELVQAIHLMTTCCYVCGKDGVDYKRCYFHKKCAGPKEIEEWLKEKHE